eukprot:c10063_g1_i1.p1 GENE.c10063_g1_i1~~c10063_g1_i1.p1  ORF type:complete len:733 (+),score=201.68 c10063_g1_i1:101-2200(+)
MMEPDDLNSMENGGNIKPKNNMSRLTSFRDIQPVNIKFQNICYSLVKKDTTRHILSDVSGDVTASTMLAIMGPTGSGKTSLVNVLAQRMTQTRGAVLSGTILVNDRVVNRRSFARISCYVLQDDALFACLTVKETLMTAAHLQLPSTLSLERKEEYVNSVISELGLNKAQNTIVGNEKQRGVSGGERKRVNIGVELIKNPFVIFLDEPTSGLDSFQAQSVMSAMRALASDGRTVIASIHQPRSSIYQMFDRLLLLSEGGVVFSGAASEAVHYFSRHDMVCPAFFNPADYFLDLVSPDYRSPEQEAESKLRISKLIELWRKNNPSQPLQAKPKRTTSMRTSVGNILQRHTSKSATPNKAGAQTSQAATNAETNSADGSADGVDEHTGYLSSWGKQFMLCFWRSFINAKRNKIALIMKAVINIFFALLVGAIYSNTSYNQKSIQDRVGVLFFFTVNQTFGALTAVLGTFFKDLAVIERERAGKAYHVSAFYLAKFFAEAPFNMIGPLLFGIIAYWIVGLNTGADRFFLFLVLLVEVTFCSIGLGVIVSVMSPNEDAANALGPMITIIQILFGGFYINLDSLPVGARWVQYLSLTRYSFEGLAVNEFTGLTFSCNDVSDNAVCIRTGEEVLQRYSFHTEVKDTIYRLAIYFVCEHLIAYTILRLKKKHYMTLEPPIAGMGNGVVSGERKIENGGLEPMEVGN